MTNQEITNFITKYIKPLEWDDSLVSSNSFYIDVMSFDRSYYKIERDNPEEMFIAIFQPRYGNTTTLGFFHNYYDAKVTCQNHHNKILLQDYFKIESVQL
jgi:hypothetical protein